MPKLTEEKIKQKVYENSLQTCEYVSGYENFQSTIKVKCLIHKIEFFTKYENIRRDNRKHHICPECQKEDLENKSTKAEVRCAYCGKVFMKSLSKLENSKSGLYFCCREHKDLAQRIESGEDFVEIRPSHYNIGANYRQKALREKPNKCFVCGWNEDIDILEVHHIDEDRTHNQLENLMILCPICHRKLTSHKYKLVDNKIIRIE